MRRNPRGFKQLDLVPTLHRPWHLVLSCFSIELFKCSLLLQVVSNTAGSLKTLRFYVPSAAGASKYSSRIALGEETELFVWRKQLKGKFVLPESFPMSFTPVKCSKSTSPLRFQNNPPKACACGYEELVDLEFLPFQRSSISSAFLWVHWPLQNICRNDNILYSFALTLPVYSFWPILLFHKGVCGQPSKQC